MFTEVHGWVTSPQCSGDSEILHDSITTLVGVSQGALTKHLLSKEPIIISSPFLKENIDSKTCPFVPKRKNENFWHGHYLVPWWDEHLESLLSIHLPLLYPWEASVFTQAVNIARTLMSSMIQLAHFYRFIRKLRPRKWTDSPKVT